MTTTEVAKRAGITYRQLDYWLRCGFVTVPEPSPGSGTAREWSAETVTAAWRLASLVRCGMKPDAAARILGSIDDAGAVNLDAGRVRIIIDRPPGSGLGWPGSTPNQERNA